MHQTRTRFEQVPLKVVCKIMDENAKENSAADPAEKKVLFAKHPIVVVRGEKS